MADNTDPNYYIVTICIYILLSLATIGIIWSILLSLTKMRRWVVDIKTKIPIMYWLLNICYWSSVIVILFSWYLFTMLYVLNDGARLFGMPVAFTIN